MDDVHCLYSTVLRTGALDNPPMGGCPGRVARGYRCGARRPPSATHQPADGPTDGTDRVTALRECGIPAGLDCHI